MFVRLENEIMIIPVDIHFFNRNKIFEKVLKMIASVCFLRMKQDILEFKNKLVVS